MDDIQRKLAAIEAQLTPGRFHRQIVTAAPLLFAAGGMIIGILLQYVLTWSVWFWLVLLALCAIAASLFFAIQKGACPPYATAYMSLVCFLCLGAIRLAGFHQPRPNDICNLVGDERTLATIRGQIITEPYVNRNEQWQFAKFTYTDPTSSFYLKLTEAETASGWAKAGGTVRVQVDEPVLDLKAGDYIKAYCWLDRFGEPTNPGQFNTARYLARKNVFIAASIRTRDAIKLQPAHRRGVLMWLRSKLKDQVTSALLGNVAPEDPAAGLLQALLLGYRGNIDNQTYEAFRKTGLSHFISLSGLHLGILLGSIWYLCKVAGLMKRARAMVCIMAIAVFLLIVPPRAPTLRAAIIGWVFCASFLFRRQPNSLNTLSLAAIILLLIRPTQLFEAGWQLSFASVLGIILLADRIHLCIYEKVTNISWFRKVSKSSLLLLIVTELRGYILGMFSVGLAAWIAGAGILLYHFYTISLFTCIWTVIAFPFVAVILIFGYLKIILSFFLPSLAAVLGIVVDFLGRLLIGIVEEIASWHIVGWNMSHILTGHVPAALIIVYYCFLFFAILVSFKRPSVKKTICTVMALVIIVFLGVAKRQRTHRDNLVITCLDVGHGQAILAQLPGRANLLFDAGSLHRSDIGRKIVAPFLDYAGTAKIDAIIASHNDIDHINGIPEIIQHCNVKKVYVNSVLLSEVDPCSPVETLKSSLNGIDPNTCYLGTDLSPSSPARLKLLWPTEQILQDETLSDNDKSVVTLIEFGGRKILLCSDIEKFAQSEILRLNPNLKADVVVAPHHGLATTMDVTFIERLDPHILICSCDRSQYERTLYSAASQQTSEHKNRPEMFYTATDGALTLTIDKDGTVRIRAFAGSAISQ
jgi:competence protein ComEC